MSPEYQTGKMRVSGAENPENKTLRFQTETNEEQ